MGWCIPVGLSSATPSTTKTSFSSLCSKGRGNWWQTWLAMAPVLEKVFYGLSWHIPCPSPAVTLLTAEEPAPSQGASTECHLLDYMGKFTCAPGCSWRSSIHNGQGLNQLALQDFCPSSCGCRYVNKSASERAESSRKQNDATAGSELNSMCKHWDFTVALAWKLD